MSRGSSMRGVEVEGGSGVRRRRKRRKKEEKKIKKGVGEREKDTRQGTERRWTDGEKGKRRSV